jgi:hypothetical protein
MTVDDALVLLVLLRTLSSENHPERTEEIELLLSRRIEWLDHLLRSRNRGVS